MKRKELANKVYEIIKNDMQMIGVKDTDIWKAIAETDDKTLLEYIEE